MFDIKPFYGNEDPRKDTRAPKAIYKELRLNKVPPVVANLVVDEVCRLRGGRSKQDLLNIRVYDICVNHLEEIRALPREGPRGGQNAIRWPGWDKCYISELSKAFKVAGYWAKGWDAGGRGRTPVVCAPEICLAEGLQAWKEIFLEKPWDD